MQVSHEAIYRSLFVQARGVLEEGAHRASAYQPKYAGSQRAARRRSAGADLVDAVSIRERPAEAQDRAVPGHWEGDLLCGANNSYIATLVERQTRFAMLIKISRP